MAFDDRQQIIEIVSDAAGQPADGFHFLCRAQLILQLLLLRLIFFQRAAHAAKRLRYAGDFVGAA